jgi:hypothetical protein
VTVHDPELEKLRKMVGLPEPHETSNGNGVRDYHAYKHNETTDRCAECHLPANNSFHALPIVNASSKLDEQAPIERSGFAGTIYKRSELGSLPKVEPLINGVLSTPCSVVLVGPTTVGKTFVGLSMACSVGTGLTWVGRAVRRCPALYVVGEGGPGLDGRIRAWEDAWQTKVADEDVMFSVKPNSLRDPIVWGEIAAEAKDHGIRFVVLDTFSSLAPDADETKDAPVITRRLSDLAVAVDGTAMLVHHTGWGDQERARGGSQLEANADEVLLLRGNSKSEHVELEVKKRKDGASGTKIWLRRKPMFGSCVIQSMDAQELAADMKDQAVTIARTVFGDPFTKAQLRDVLEERLRVSRSVAYEHIKKLAEAGKLRQVGGTGRAATYEIR